MAWQIPFGIWLAHAALGGLLVFSAGFLAARLCRQPIQRLRVIELTLLGCLLVPWLSLVSGVPQWSLGWLPASEPRAEAPMPPALPLDGRFEERERLEQAVFAERAKERTAENANAPSVPQPPSSEPVPAPIELPQLADAGRWFTTLAMLLGGYVAFTFGFVIWWIAGLVKLLRLVRSTYPLPDTVRAVFRHIAGEAGNRVRLLASERIDLPLTFTWRHPVIVVPASLCQSSDERALRFCLAH